MPVYNVEKYLSASIESVLNQSFADFELLIINDGSTDRSEEIVKRYKDPRIRYYAKTNEGVSRTLNYGLKLARGTYVRRHDADDISTPNSLQEQVEFITSHPEVGLVASQQAFMTERGMIAAHYKLPRDSYFNGQPFRYVSLDDFTYDASSPIVHGTVLFERLLVDKLGGYRTEFLTSEDNDLWTRILDHKKIVVLNSCSYHLRLHSASATRKHASSLLFYRKLVKDFALERSRTGSDPLMRGGPVPKPAAAPVEERVTSKPGKLFRGDLLNYHFKVVWDAKDWREIFSITKHSLMDGWRLSGVWTAILFPILGSRLVAFGVRVKSVFRRRSRGRIFLT